MDKIYDVTVVGGGPAGLSAALYAARANLSVILVEKLKEGGQITLASMVGNYPGGVRGEDGQSLADRMVEQCRHYGVEFLRGEVTGFDLSGDVKKVTVAGSGIESKVVILALGRRPLRLNVPGEEEFIGRGVSYCAACDGPFFSGMNIAVAGGGDAAIEEAIYLTKFARKVTVVHRRGSLRAAKSIQDKAKANDKIEFIWDSVIREIRGINLVDRVVVENNKSGDISTIEADGEDGMMGVFVFIGHQPNTDNLTGLLEMEDGYIITDEEMNTSIPGVFAAGDARKKSFRQVVTAVADGALAAFNAERYLNP